MRRFLASDWMRFAMLRRAAKRPLPILVFIATLAAWSSAHGQSRPDSAVAPRIDAYGAWANQTIIQPPANMAYLLPVEGRILDLLNGARANTGLPALPPSPSLQAIARVHAADMIARGFFDHVNPDGFDPATRVALLDRGFVGITGENIGEITGNFPGGELDLAGRFHTNWMNSPGHRQNVLRDDWTSVGIGVAAVAGKFLAVQVFGRETARVLQPPPVRMARGTQWDLRATGLTGSPEFVDLWDPNRSIALSQPTQMLAGPITAPAGTYQLRYYFRRGRMFDIFDGPLIVVE